jgi:GT2 family glycosyltransferase
MASDQSVSILIPFKNQIPILLDCLKTMAEALQEEVVNVELVLINNQSDQAELEQLLEELKAFEQYTSKVIDANIDFNFQTLINLGSREANGRFLLLLNNDIVFTERSKGFLQKMRQKAQLPGVGAVGALLLYPDGTIQHSGVVVGMNQYADHVYRGWSKEDADAFPFTSYSEDRYVSAVTAACLMVERSKFTEVSGMDERFIVCGGDVDFCLRLLAQGYRNIYLGSVEMIHLESKSRSNSRIPEVDFVESRRSYSTYLDAHNGRDPYYPEPLPLVHLPLQIVIPHSATEPNQDSATDTNQDSATETNQGIEPISTNYKASWLKRNVIKLSQVWQRLRTEPFELFVANFIVNKRRQLLHYLLHQPPSLPDEPPLTQEPEIQDADSLGMPYNVQPIGYYQESVLNPKPRLNILLPHLIESGTFGGIVTAILIGLKLKAKYPYFSVRFLLTDEYGGSVEVLKKKLRFYMGPEVDHLSTPVIDVGDRRHTAINIHSRDYFLATAWWTCYSAKELSSGHPFFYLIQDFEPAFYSWCREYYAALTTYQMNCIPIFNTTLLKEYFIKENIISEQKANSGITFEPAIDAVRFHPRADRTQPKPKRTLLFYGRPSVARNLFTVGIQGIAAAVRQRILDPMQWEFLSAGEFHAPLRLDENTAIQSLGKIPLEEYADLLQKVDIGVSLMLSPHPSYPPLEMAASGVICVTNSYATKDLSLYHSNLISCEPSVEGIVEGIQVALRKLERPSVDSGQQIDLLTYNWNDSLATTLDTIFQVMKAEKQTSKSVF